MEWFNNFLMTVVPYFPKWAVGIVAKKYIAGETIEEAVEEIVQLNKNGFLATTDVLGENINSKEDAAIPVENYLELLDTIDQENLNSGISLKLTQLGLKIDKELAWNNFAKVLDKAKSRDIFLRIDMEDSSCTDDTIEFYRKARRKYKRTGTVFQSYLYRTEKDIEDLMEEAPTNLRICKGIYKEPPEISYQDEDLVSNNFFKMVRLCLENDVYTAIATHDLELIQRCEDFIRDNDINPGNYEFQALLGVPVENTLKRLIDEGHKVRYYVPFGEEWYAYSMRRLQENPDLAGYIFKDFFKIKSS
jgi:proline dehydrogenase